MRRLFLAAAAGLLSAGGAAPTVQNVPLKAADGLPISGQYYPAGPGAPLILLFHQAGSNKAEYATTAPRLVQAGFSCLAIDQRSGGGLFGGDNLTAAAYTKRHGGDKAVYSEALPDLEAALAWGKTKSKKLLLLGSSYSGGLVFELAARHPNDVAAVLAFSPEVTSSALAAAPNLRMPVFVTSASGHIEVDSAKRLLDAVASPVKVQFVPEQGPHGAAALVREGNGADTAPYWKALLDFLKPLR